MILSLNWLKELVDIEGISAEEIVKRITLSTAEVEGVENKGDDMDDVVVAKVVTCEKVEGTHLNLLSVDDGSGEMLQIATGAPNVYAGMITALVRVGGMVAGHKIKKARLAGIDSFGMCCSEAELGIGSDDDGIIDFKDLDCPLGTNLKDIYPINDTLIEIDNKSLTNRPDLWGHFGFARELSVIFNRKLKGMELLDLAQYEHLQPLDVTVQTNACYRYSALRVENVNVKRSPMEMKIRLNYCGLRDINLLADLTNYVMLELGTPMHAFDSAKVDGIIVREANDGEKLLTLEGEEHEISKGSLLICNKDNTPVAIAGIKGGKLSGISDETTGFTLESAVFEASAIRKTSKAIGLVTDASQRYEKSLDPEMTDLAIARLVKLLQNIDNGIKVESKLSDVVNYERKEIVIDINCDFIRKRIGAEISNEFIVNTLADLGFKVRGKNENLTLVVPSHRATKDVSIKEDIVEEIARLYGYDNIVPTTLALDVLPVSQDNAHVMEYKTKRLLAEKYNFNEVHSYIWNYSDFNSSIGVESPSYLTLLDSSNSGQSGIRSELVLSLVKFFSENKNNFNEIKIDEIGRVVVGKDENNLAIEEKHLACLMSSTERSEKDLYFEMKKILENIASSLAKVRLSYDTNISNGILHPNMGTKVMVNDVCIGYFGVLHPNVLSKLDKKARVVVLEVDFNKFMQFTNPAKTYKPISKFQTVELDFNFLVPKNKTYSEVQEILSTFRCKMNMTYKLKDVYENESFGAYRSETFTFAINSNEHTLSANEIDNFSRRLTEHMKNAGINLR
ncbi:MAG: phenylalanine--tRNA ligase subunit beta [Clostridia bacterium]|nr:phenylalanine--tRNA ligase subunit beta [Clostridia bacterium]